MIRAVPQPTICLMERSCSCGGSNENCIWCNGRGSVGVGGPHTGLSAKNEVAAVDRQRPPYGVPLVYCEPRTQTEPLTTVKVQPRTEVKDEAYTAHELPLVARAGHTKFPKYRTPTSPRWERCSKCQALVVSGKMDDHNWRLHGGAWPGNLSNKVKGIHPCPPGLTPCGVCSSPVRPDRLEAHMKRVHGGAVPSGGLA